MYCPNCGEINDVDMIDDMPAQTPDTPTGYVCNVCGCEWDEYVRQEIIKDGEPWCRDCESAKTECECNDMESSKED